MFVLRWFRRAEVEDRHDVNRSSFVLLYDTHLKAVVLRLPSKHLSMPSSFTSEEIKKT